MPVLVVARLSVSQLQRSDSSNWKRPDPSGGLSGLPVRRTFQSSVSDTVRESAVNRPIGKSALRPDHTKVEENESKQSPGSGELPPYNQKAADGIETTGGPGFFKTADSVVADLRQA